VSAIKTPDKKLQRHQMADL